VSRYTGIIEAFRNRMPLAPEARAISLGEGRTPLIRLENLPRLEGVEAEIYVKFEGLNPTGSFKDRGMTVAVTQAVYEGSRAIICASTGNTSAAAAAYAARAGIKAFVLIPEGKIALGKLAQALVHGATVLQVRGNFDLSRMRTSGMDTLIESNRRPAHCFESHRPGRVGETYKPFRSMQGQTADGHHRLSAVEQSQPFLYFERKRFDLRASQSGGARHPFASVESFAFADHV